jgi:hypothetical protein
MKVTIKVNNNGFEMEMEVEGGKTEIMAAQNEAIKELEPGGTIELVETESGRRISWARKPRQ